MKKLNLNVLSFQKGEMLTRSQLKKVLGGNEPTTSVGGGGGTRCVFYCCSNSGGCSTGVSVNMSCTTNEGCQASGASGVTCSPGLYVAALCKS